MKEWNISVIIKQLILDTLGHTFITSIMGLNNKKGRKHIINCFNFINKTELISLIIKPLWINLFSEIEVKLLRVMIYMSLSDKEEDIECLLILNISEYVDNENIWLSKILETGSHGQRNIACKHIKLCALVILCTWAWQSCSPNSTDTLFIWSSQFGIYYHILGRINVVETSQCALVILFS